MRIISCAMAHTWAHAARQHSRVCGAGLLMLATLLPGAAAANQALAQQRNCLACHAVDRPLLGPSYIDVAARYKGRPDAMARLTDKVLKGGSGVWGAAAMPANPIPTSEARQLVAWVLSLDAAGRSSLSAPPAASRSTPAVKSPPPRSDASAFSEGVIRRGRYLVEGVMACGNCHSPRAADTSLVPGRDLTGGRTYNLPAYTVTPANLTPDDATGLGRWSVADIAHLLKSGRRPNGLPLAPMMPVAFYQALTADDAQAVGAYLRTLVPVENAVPPPLYKEAFTVDAYPDAQVAYSAPAMAKDPIVRGRYLATLAHCLDCHTPVVDGVTHYERDGGKGGKRMGVARVLVANITSHPTAGLGAWTDAEIRRALTEGIARDGRRLQYPMPWPYLARLTASDVDALIAWLRTLPPKE